MANPSGLFPNQSSISVRFIFGLGYVWSAVSLGELGQSIRPPLKVKSTKGFANSKAAMPAICQKSACDIV